MMDTIEKLEQLREYMNSSPFPKPEFSKACEEAIKAIENQTKYENALVEMTQYFRCNVIKGLYLPEEECHKYKSCAECMTRYFKNLAGLEVSE
jgi:hypothetical protein